MFVCLGRIYSFTIPAVCGVIKLPQVSVSLPCINVNLELQSVHLDARSHCGRNNQALYVCSLCSCRLCLDDCIHQSVQVLLEFINTERSLSNRAVADHLLMKKQLFPGSTLEQRRRNEHDRWMRFHALYNWTYDAERDNNLRRHPSMLPFEQLSEAEQAKDDYAWKSLSE